MNIHIILAILLGYNGICNGNRHLHPGYTPYGEGWETDIDCETGELRYPFCSEVDESPINIKSDRFLDDSDDDDGVCSQGPLVWHYLGSEGSQVYKNDHTIGVNPLQDNHHDNHHDKHHDNHHIRDSTNGENQWVAWFENPWTDEATHTDGHVEKYCFDGLHFHWGLHNKEGSEHLLDGKPFVMEAHFVHYNCARGSIEDVISLYETTEQRDAARENDEDYHELAVIGVWFTISERDNPVIEQILDAYDRIKKENHCECHAEDADELPCYKDPISGEIKKREGHLEPISGTCHVNVSHIDLRPLVDTIGGYYTYEGSLTTPPCTDDVRWFVLRKYASISRRQMERMRAITKPCSDELMAPNYRHVQDNENPQYSCDSYDGRYDECRKDLRKAKRDYYKLYGYLLNIPQRKRGDDNDDDDDSDESDGDF